jgi:hypothetical protein
MRKLSGKLKALIVVLALITVATVIYLLTSDPDLMNNWANGILGE